MNEGPYIELLKYSIGKGQALIAGSDDWENRLWPALADFCTLIPVYPSIQAVVKGIRCLTETAYKMGYERGQREARNPLPRFVVAEEQEPAP